MEDDSHGGNGRADGGSPESPYMKNGNNNGSSNKEQDRFLPIANVGRIMKKVLPANGKISKDAKETVQECVSEFISFVTGEASDKCQREKRKTINGDDIIWAITTLGFEDYVTPLKLYLSKYRDLEGERVNVPKNQRVAVDQRLHHEQQQQCMPTYNNNNNNNNNINHNNNNHNNHSNNNNNIFSSTSLMSHPPFIATDPISFSLPFSPNSIPKQLQPQEQIDSAGQW